MTLEPQRSDSLGPTWGVVSQGKKERKEKGKERNKRKKKHAKHQ